MVCDSLSKKVLAFCRPLFPPDTALLVAVSGGCDSVALFYLLQRLQRLLGVNRLGIVHVNHRLRGLDSDEDERFVKNMAESAGVEFYAKRLTGKKMGQAGVEAWAREERYRFFMRIKKKHGYHLAATGHTADDQAETLLMRLLRGAGLQGMTGIHACRDDGVVRPLLAIRKCELIDWLGLNKIPYREDSSNRDTSIKRNWVRHELLPLVDLKLPGGIVSIADFALSAQQLQHEMSGFINNWITRNVIQESKYRFCIAVKAFNDGPFVSESVSQFLRRLDIPFTRYHIEGILRLGNDGRGTVLLPGGWRCESGHEGVIVCKGRLKQSGSRPFCFDLAVPGVTRCGTVAKFRAVRCEPVRPAQAVSEDNNTVYLDESKGLSGLQFRSWRKGDRFRPFGRRTSCELNDFLKKQRIPQEERTRLAVVARKDGTIVWVPGIRIAHDFRIRSDTRQVIRFSCEYLR